MRTSGPALALAAAALTGAVGPAGASPPGAGAPVVGGDPADAGAWSDAAAVYFGDSPGCTGTLIAPDVVLTAGHCIGGARQVKLGVNKLTAEGGETIAVAKEIQYPDYLTTYDVGLLVLEQPSAVTPRVLASGCVVERFVQNGAPVAIVGWGATNQRGDQTSNVLMEGQSTISDVDCAEGHGCNGAVNPGGELTAGGDDVDSCFGDSGGPLYLLTDIGEFLVGVTSRGFDDAQVPCGEGGIYVRTDAVIDWIEQESGEPLPRATCNARPVLTADVTTLEVRSGESVGALVTANDPDPGDTHVYAVATAPAHGEAEVDGDGNVVYTAGDDYDGADSFAIRVSDDGVPSLSSDVEFAVTVLPGEGCGCHTTGRGGPETAVLIGLAAAVTLARRRRRRR
jgi:MYXO-CTERM domain-containing protein